MTMHRVLNFGSALQAYALQQKLKELGYENELIDYIFPQPEKKKFTIGGLISDIIIFLRNALIGFPTERKKRKFKAFKERHLIVSSKEYDHQSINQHPPIYDLYMTGSDQVWSPRHVKENTDFMFPFVPDGSKIASFAASFAVDVIPQEYQQSYSNALSRYSKITVRESFGCDIVKQLTGKESQTVCDPTLLLDNNSWNKLADAASNTEKEPYILVYILTYMYNPYPEVDLIIKKVQDELGYKVIFLNGRMQDFGKPNSKILKDAGPCEFLNLIRNAKFVITTSYHGVAFASVFGVPFYGIVKSKNEKGDRIHSLLQKLDCMLSLIAYNEVPSLRKNDLSRFACKEKDLAMFREESTRILTEIVKV